MYKRVHYNSYLNKINLWEINEKGRTVHKEITPELKFYIEDKTKKSPIKDIYGNPVIQKTAKTQAEMRKYKDTGILTCETDFSGTTKFLQEYYKDKELKFDISQFQICCLDIETEISKDGSFSRPEDPKTPINLVTMYFSKSNRLVTLGLQEYTGNNSEVKEYHWFHSEKMLIEKMIDIFRSETVDVITGWNVKGFDLLYIVKRAEMLGIEKNFSPLNKYYIKTKNENNSIVYDISFDGLSILDYMLLYKKFTYEPRESFSLQAIGKIEVDEGKKDYTGTLNDLAENNWNDFVLYNIQDVLLVMKLENGNLEAKDPKKRSGLKLIELTIQMCSDALVNYEDVFSSMAVLLGYILKFLHKENLVLPDRKHTTKDKLPGAMVRAYEGSYKYLISYDFSSLYPTLIRQYNISPETLVLNPSEEEKKNLYSTPLSEYKTWHLETGETISIGGIYYKKEQGILSKIVTKISNEREEFKKKMFEARDKGDKSSEEFYRRHQLIKKILQNSLYGTISHEMFHLFNYNNAISITLGGQHLIKYVSETSDDYFKNYYLQNIPNISDRTLSKSCAILLDTDSTYFTFEELIEKLELKFQNDDEFLKWANDLDKNFLKDFFKNILEIYAEQFGTPNIMNFKREKIITDMFVLSKKKYVTKVKDKEGETYDPPKFNISGIEIVRSSTPLFCRNKLLDVVKLIVNTKDKELILKSIRKYKKDFLIEDIKNIAFPRGIKEYTKYAKDVSFYLKNKLSYPSSCPIHVRAAMNYNYIVAKNKFKLIPISNGNKIKFVFVKPNNILNQNVIGFINEWPKEFNDIFEIDYETQFEKSFISVIERFFEVLNWGEVNLKVSKLKDFFKKN